MNRKVVQNSGFVGIKHTGQYEVVKYRKLKYTTLKGVYLTSVLHGINYFIKIDQTIFSK
jgi:hypothetical protein